MSGTALGTSPDRGSAHCHQKGWQIHVAEETSTLLPSFSYFTMTFNYPNEVSSAIGTGNINPGQP